jgi:hypothetical protein
LERYLNAHSKRLGVKHSAAVTFISLAYVTLTEVSLPPTYLAKPEGHELIEYVKYTSVLEEMMRYLAI